MTEQVKELTNDEFWTLASKLESYHTVFRKIWTIGVPRPTDKIPTACVTFDRQGNFLTFLYNPEFWNSLNERSKLFLICHECMHVVLQHGLRMKGLIPEVANIAADVVINEYLVRGFGFRREELNLFVDGKDGCWLDTVFTPEENVIYGKNMEYYYAKFMQSGRVKVINVSLADDHSQLPGSDGDLPDQFLDKMADALGKEDIEKLEKLSQRDKPDDKTQTSKAGQGGGSWFQLLVNRVRKVKWEHIVRNWSIPFMQEKEVTQWAIPNRRFSMLQPNMFMPNDRTDEFPIKNKTRVFFFMDVSGSCYHLAQRFLNAANSLPLDKFNARFFAFDTQVVEVDIHSGKMYGGGGTAFDIIEDAVLRESVRKGDPYPDGVFVLTDGEGNLVKPMYPEKWVVMLTENGSKEYLPSEARFFNLKDYE